MESESRCIVCGEKDGGIPWQLMPKHPKCRQRVTSPLSYDEQVEVFKARLEGREYGKRR